MTPMLQPASEEVGVTRYAPRAFQDEASERGVQSSGPTFINIQRTAACRGDGMTIFPGSATVS
jgi:hypothetical protein